ncbi:MAG: helix-turn-helix domain-containing protein [Ramlibacter sp.]
MFQRWSTEHIAPTRRVEFWRDAVCDAFLAMTPRLVGSSQQFVATLQHQPLDAGLSLNTVSAPSHAVARTASDLGRGGPAMFFINVPLGGQSRLSQFGREHTVSAGGLMLIDSSNPYELEQSGPTELASLAVPESMLQRLVGDVRPWVARPAPSTAAAALLAAQVQALARWQEPIAPHESGMLADTLQGLLQAVFSGAQAQPVSGPHLVRRVRASILQSYAQAGLAPADVAQAAGVSVRSLHAALAQEGTTFTRELASHRLERARLLLRSPLCKDSVQAIALRCGYKSQAHFARSFQARYGMTPTACRGR